MSAGACARPPRPSGHPLLALPCCAQRSAAPGPDWLRRCLFEQPTGVGRAGVGTDRFLALCFLQQKARGSDASGGSAFRPPKGCRRTQSSIAVVPSFSIHLPLCSTGFHQPPRYYEEIRLLRGRRPVVVASFGSTARADPRRPPWVRTLNVPPPPPPIPLRPRLDFGRRVSRHADPAGPACSGVHFHSVLRFASGFFPTRPHGASTGVSRRQGLRAVASGSRLLPPRPAKDFHLQSSAHARHTRSGYALPSTPPRRHSHPDCRAVLTLIVARQPKPAGHQQTIATCVRLPIPRKATRPGTQHVRFEGEGRGSARRRRASRPCNPAPSPRQ